jgi:hypothetical protein
VSWLQETDGQLSASPTLPPFRGADPWREACECRRHMQASDIGSSAMFPAQGAGNMKLYRNEGDDGELWGYFFGNDLRSGGFWGQGSARPRTAGSPS